MQDECMTCMLLKSLLKSVGVPSMASETIAYSEPVQEAEKTVKKKVKRKASAYSKKYSKAFKQIQDKYKTKAGKWKKDGFKKAQAAAHKLAKRM